MSLSPQTLSALTAQFGGRLTLLPHERLVYGYDATGVSAMPDAVLRVRTVEDVRGVVSAAQQTGTPIVARGAGTGLSAGAVPVQGGIVLSFETMRAVSLDRDRRRAWVEPGVVNQSLDRDWLAPAGLFYPPDPASHRVSTIGGNIAENSGGPRAVKYGVTGHHVSRLEVVDASGAAGPLAAGELQQGPDLVSLVIGSEGTLALVTRAELRLQPAPERTVTVLLSFAEMEDATAFVSEVIAVGIVPATLEFIDRPTIDAIEAWGVVRYPEGARAVLLLDLGGSTGQVERDAQRVEQLGTRMRALAVAVARDEAERDALWRGRRGAYAAVGRYGKRILTQDVTVPRTRLTDMLEEVGRIARRYGLFVATVGHAGDGNLHPDFPYDPDDAEISARVHDANVEILRACVARGGSITGEHGIGSDKLHAMPLMYGPAELGLMAAVKRALDPNHILNPGKAVPMVDRPVGAGAGCPHAAPETEEQLREAVLYARARKAPLAIDLTRFTGIAIDAHNLTIEVGAGDRWERLESALVETPFTLPITPLRESTVARVVLLNDYGPEHASDGTLRQWLLAARYVTGAGEIVHMGRSVVKNVAGYDLFRPLIGSRGRLGVPTRFVFRLTPRSDSPWMMRPWPIPPDGELDPTALVVLPDGAMLTAHARFRDAAPSGWFAAGSIGSRLAQLRNEIDRDDHILDLAWENTLPPSDLLEGEIEPLVLLPAASRLIARSDRDTAMRLVRRAQGRGRQVRALWGVGRERLGPPDALSHRWEHVLHAVFDPDAVLASWMGLEERR